MSPAATARAASTASRRGTERDPGLPEATPKVESRPDLRVVDRHRRRRGWQVGTVAGIVLFTALFAVAGFQTLIVSSQKQLDDLNRDIGAASTQGVRLDSQLAELQSPQRITSEATQRLGMVSPPGVAYLQPRTDDDARAGEVPEPAPPPTAPTTTVPKSTSTTTTPKATTPKATTVTPKATTATPASGGSGR